MFIVGLDLQFVRMVFVCLGRSSAEERLSVIHRKVEARKRRVLQSKFAKPEALHRWTDGHQMWCSVNIHHCRTELCCGVRGRHQHHWPDIKQ